MGKQTFVISHSGQSVDVKAFTEKIDGISKVTIVDAVISYDCTYTGDTFLLVARNALCVLGMDQNLLLTFIKREAGLVVNDTPKIHTDDPSVEDQSIFLFKNQA